MRVKLSKYSPHYEIELNYLPLTVVFLSFTELKNFTEFWAIVNISQNNKFKMLLMTEHNCCKSNNFVSTKQFFQIKLQFRNIS